MIINEIELFEGVSYEVMNKIAEICSEENHAKGTVLFEKGEKAEALYILQEGTIDLVIKNGTTLTYRLDEPGEVFGWSSMVESGHYTASGVCATDVMAIKIEKEKIDLIFHHHPDAGFRVLKRLGGVISRRLSYAYRDLLATKG